MSVDWGYFDKFEWADEKYLPCRGEGETKATQIGMFFKPRNHIIRHIGHIAFS